MDSLYSDDKIMLFLYSSSLFTFKQYHHYTFLRISTSTDDALSTTFLHLLDWHSPPLSCQVHWMINLITIKSYNLFTNCEMFVAFYHVKLNLFNSYLTKVLLTSAYQDEFLNSFHNINWFIILWKINMFTVVAISTIELKNDLCIHNCNNWNWLWKNQSHHLRMTNPAVHFTMKWSMFSNLPNDAVISVRYIKFVCIQEWYLKNVEFSLMYLTKCWITSSNIICVTTCKCF